MTISTVNAESSMLSTIFLGRVETVKATGIADKTIIEDYFGQKKRVRGNRNHSKCSCSGNRRNSLAKRKTGRDKAEYIQ